MTEAQAVDLLSKIDLSNTHMSEMLSYLAIGFLLLLILVFFTIVQAMGNAR